MGVAGTGRSPVEVAAWHPADAEGERRAQEAATFCACRWAGRGMEACQPGAALGVLGVW